MTLTDGTTPDRDDSQDTLLMKWLTAVQTGLGGSANAANNPAPGDSRWVLLYKIARAKAGL